MTFLHWETANNADASFRDSSRRECALMFFPFAQQPPKLCCYHGGPQWLRLWGLLRTTTDCRGGGGGGGCGYSTDRSRCSSGAVNNDPGLDHHHQK